MTESDLRASCPSVWKSYRAKKGAVTRLAQKSHHMRALAEYTCYDEKLGACESECIVEMPCSNVLNYGIWEAVKMALIEAKKIAYDSVDFGFTRVCGFDSDSHCIGEVNF